MRYLGGKFRQGKVISEQILNRGVIGTYIEPFCGGLNSAEWAVKRGITNICLSDIHRPLITMWKCVFDGWEPPHRLTVEQYNMYESIQNPDDPMTAFVGYGGTFGAVYYNGYGRDTSGIDNETFISRTANSVQRTACIFKKNNIGSDVLFCCDYKQWEDVSGCTFYMDPPYIGRSRQQPRMPKFNHNEFWDFVRIMSKSNKVYVTEFVWPSDFEVIHSFGDTVIRHLNSRGGDGTNEVLLVYGG